jgi:hypothetical protein
MGCRGYTPKYRDLIETCYFLTRITLTLLWTGPLVRIVAENVRGPSVLVCQAVFSD